MVSLATGVGVALRVLFAAAEVFPFAKTGGLGDVAGSLPKALKGVGHEVVVIMPCYRGLDRWGADLGRLKVPMGTGTEVVALRQANLTPQIPVLLIEHRGYFDSEQIYGYEDDGRRFALFSRAVLEASEYRNLRPHIIHCNDWHTALVPAYLQAYYADVETLRDAKVLYTIHNLRHQGSFPKGLLGYLGLPRGSVVERHLLHQGKVNMMKAGIALSDGVSTVSETYAREIQTAEYGCGLQQILRRRSDRLFGILNGIDEKVWDPENDPLIAVRFRPPNTRAKEGNKRALREELSMEPSRAPIIGFIARLVEQKGIDLVEKALPELMSRRMQMVILGTGKEEFEKALGSWRGRNPALSINLRYDETLAHRIYAGADMFLVPSRFEPCGLGQMISMRYGTVPIVRRTGGLADTVNDYAQGLETATGFTFDKYNSNSMVEAVDRALAAYQEKQEWSRIVENCSRQDFSWNRSSQAYSEVYDALTSQGPGTPP